MASVGAGLPPGLHVIGQHPVYGPIVELGGQLVPLMMIMQMQGAAVAGASVAGGLEDEEAEDEDDEDDDEEDEDDEDVAEDDDEDANA